VLMIVSFDIICSPHQLSCMEDHLSVKSEQNLRALAVNMFVDIIGRHGMLSYCDTSIQLVPTNLDVLVKIHRARRTI